MCKNSTSTNKAIKDNRQGDHDNIRGDSGINYTGILF